MNTVLLEHSLAATSGIGNTQKHISQTHSLHVQGVRGETHLKMLVLWVKSCPTQKMLSWEPLGPVNMALLETDLCRCKS